MGARLRRPEVADWVAELWAVGIGAQEVWSPAELMSDEDIRVSITQHCDEAGAVTMPGSGILVEGRPVPPGEVVRRPDADALPVLAQVGVDADQARRLASQEVVQLDALPEGWADF